MNAPSSCCASFVPHLSRPGYFILSPSSWIAPCPLSTVTVTPRKPYSDGTGTRPRIRRTRYARRSVITFCTIVVPKHERHGSSTIHECSVDATTKQQFMSRKDRYRRDISSCYGAMTVMISIERRIVSEKALVCPGVFTSYFSQKKNVCSILITVRFPLNLL